MLKKYGLFIGRLQPIHAGHEWVINEIFKDKLHPIIFIGSSNKINVNNPLTYIQRSAIVNKIYKGDVTVLPLPDCIYDSDWADNIRLSLDDLGIDINECVFYYHLKRGDYDLHSLLESHVEIKDVVSDISISASNIRSDVYGNIGYIHPDVSRDVMDLFKKQ